MLFRSLVNDAISPVRLPLNSLNFTSNSSVVTVVHPSHGFNHGSTVALSGFDGAYNIPAGNVNKQHTVGNVTLDSYSITVGNIANRSISHVSGNITATRDLVFNVLQPIIEYRDYPGTSITFKANVTSGLVVSSTDRETVSIIANENNYFTAPKAVKSTLNETGVGSTRKSLLIKSLLSTTVDNLSPVLDLNRTSAIVVTNRINNLTEANVTFVHDTSNVLTSNANISLTGNLISTNHPGVANILGTLHVGKSLQISSNAGVNANVIISRIQNDFSGNANVEVYYAFSTQPVSSNVVTQIGRAHV